MNDSRVMVSFPSNESSHSKFFDQINQESVQVFQSNDPRVMVSFQPKTQVCLHSQVTRLTSIG